MPRTDIRVPEYDLLAGFWKVVRDDITGRGCLEGHLTTCGAIMERRTMRHNARQFLDTEDFTQWADLSGADPVALREDLLNAYQHS